LSCAVRQIRRTTQDRTCALEADEQDREEMLAVAELMERLRAPG